MTDGASRPTGRGGAGPGGARLGEAGGGALSLQVAEEPGATSTGQRSRCWGQRCHGLNFENAEASSRDPSLKTRDAAKPHINFEVAGDFHKDDRSLQLMACNHGLHLVS